RGDEGFDLAEALGHPFSLAGMHFSVGYLHIRRGETGPAIALLERGVSICQTWHIQIQLPIAESLCGYAQVLAGRLGDGLPRIEQAAERAMAMQVRLLYPLMLTLLGEAYLLAGQAERALDVGERADELARTRGERGHKAWAQRLLGEIAAHADPPDVEQAEAYCHQALALADELGMRPLVAHCHLGLGTLYQRVGRDQQAQSELAIAREMYRAMEMPLWLERAEAALTTGSGRPT